MARVELMTDDQNTPRLSLDLPGNSNKDKAAKASEERIKVHKVVKGKAIQKKKPLSRKMADLFFGEEVTDVKGYLITDVVVPGIKNLITDIVQDGIEMVMFGEARGRRVRNATKSGSYVSYNSISDRRRPAATSERRGPGYYAKDNICETRGEAEEVLSTLIELIDTYGSCKVADLNTMMGVSGDFTDNYWGWTNLSSAGVKRVREGYLIDLPRPENLKA